MGGYSPTYGALFGKPLLNQAIAILQRDQGDAITIVNSTLLPINEFHKGPGMRTALPWLTLGLTGVRFGIDQFPYTRSEQVTMGLVLDVGQYDQEIAQDMAQDYGRVLDMVLTTATSADWVTPMTIVHETVPSGMTSPGMVGTVKMVFPESHVYSVVFSQWVENPIMRVTVNMLFHLEEQ